MASINKKIASITLTCMAPSKTFNLAGMSTSFLVITNKELKKFFIEKAKVGMNAGITFGTGGSGFMRMNIACPRSTLGEALA